MVSDPPWNVSAQRISGFGKTKHADFAQAFGEMSEQEYQNFCTAFIALMVAYALPGLLIYLFVDWAHLGTLTAGATANGLVQKNLLVWACHAGAGSNSARAGSHAAWWPAVAAAGP